MREGGEREGVSVIKRVYQSAHYRWCACIWYLYFVHRLCTLSSVFAIVSVA